ncbi:MAG: hypothetical protein GY747_02610 [Planctomycetes bacterium]|nr:hypothetical protein [Planctomycetota bacterium]MCP4860644.1 hypothetical protein [Planctomycetota bacterium]
MVSAGKSTAVALELRVHATQDGHVVWQVITKSGAQIGETTELQDSIAFANLQFAPKILGGADRLGHGTLRRLQRFLDRRFGIWPGAEDCIAEHGLGDRHLLFHSTNKNQRHPSGGFSDAKPLSDCTPMGGQALQTDLHYIRKLLLEARQANSTLIGIDFDLMSNVAQRGKSLKNLSTKSSWIALQRS